MLFVTLILAACAPQPQPMPAPLPTAEMEIVTEQYKIYFPFTVKAAPIIIDSRSGPEICMAWSGQFLDKAKVDFGANMYYHSGTWRVPNQNSIPIVRSLPGHREDIANQLLYLKSIRWNGLVILANEPDMVDQDNIKFPKDLAGLYWYATQILPDATFIVPNAIDLNYLDEFLDYAAIRSKDRIGIHIYQGNRYDNVHTWPTDWIARLEAILGKHNIDNRYWISEVGLAEVWTRNISTRYVSEILSSDAEVACIYTTNCGTYLSGCGWDLYGSDGGLTTGGNALASIILPLQANAYP